MKIFAQHDPGVLVECDVPKPIPTCSDPSPSCSDELVSIVLKYIYNNQNLEAVKDQISERKSSQVFSQAYVMGCSKLMQDLGSVVVSDFLNAENVVEQYLDAIRFDNQGVAAACEIIILEQLNQIMETEKGSKFIINLPISQMTQLCQHNNLNVSSEFSLSKIIESYL
jgi:hypothetical protein